MTRDLPGPRACFTWRVEDGVAAVEDLDDGRSVTNDAEAVVASLAREGLDLSSPPVIAYRDTMGTWDGLLVRDGEFAGFLPLRGRTFAEARAALVALGYLSPDRAQSASTGAIAGELLGDVLDPSSQAGTTGTALPVSDGLGAERRQQLREWQRRAGEPPPERLN